MVLFYDMHQPSLFNVWMNIEYRLMSLWFSTLCHRYLTFAFGVRFNYMHYEKKYGAIHKSIEALDKMGMDIIETGDADAFKQYLLEYDNTICGRHPISVFLHVSASSFS